MKLTKRRLAALLGGALVMVLAIVAFSINSNDTPKNPHQQLQAVLEGHDWERGNIGQPYTEDGRARSNLVPYLTGNKPDPKHGCTLLAELSADSDSYQIIAIGRQEPEWEGAVTTLELLPEPWKTGFAKPNLSKNEALKILAGYPDHPLCAPVVLPQPQASPSAS